MVEHQSRKLGVVGSNPTGGTESFDRAEKKLRSWQGSNLRGQSPLDFKSNALTTRPQLLQQIEVLRNIAKVKNCGDAGDRTPGLSHAKRTLYH